MRKLSLYKLYNFLVNLPTIDWHSKVKKFKLNCTLNKYELINLNQYLFKLFAPLWSELMTSTFKALLFLFLAKFKK
jgi:hypothetical protein